MFGFNYQDISTVLFPKLVLKFPLERYICAVRRILHGDPHMIDVAITKLSSKGQIVIPSEMRDGFSKGEKLVIIKNEGQLILKRIKDLSKNFEEDLIFAKKTEEALKRYEQGFSKEMSAKDFANEIEKW